MLKRISDFLESKTKTERKIISVEFRTHGKSINNPISFETSFKLFNAIQNLSEYPELLRFHPKFLFYLDRYWNKCCFYAFDLKNSVQCEIHSEKKKNQVNCINPHHRPLVYTAPISLLFSKFPSFSTNDKLKLLMIQHFCYCFLSSTLC